MSHDRVPHVLTDIYWHGDEVVIAAHGEIDCCTAAGLAERLREVIEVAHPRRLVLDLADVPFLDCAGARVIAVAQVQLGVGGHLVLRSVQPVPAKVIEITGLVRGCVTESTRRPGRGRGPGWPPWRYRSRVPAG